MIPTSDQIGDNSVKLPTGLFCNQDSITRQENIRCDLYKNSLFLQSQHTVSGKKLTLIFFREVLLLNSPRQKP